MLPISLSLNSSPMLNSVALVDHPKFFPNRSRSTGEVSRQLVLHMQKPLRSRSMPSLPRKMQQEQQQELEIPSSSTCHGIPCASSATVPPPLCRWSSAPPCEQMVNMGSEHSSSPNSEDDQKERRKKSLMSPPNKPLRTMMYNMSLASSFKKPNSSSLPPRLPRRKSGKAIELRSALPPRFPQRKPGEATMEAKALPPFMPRRCSMDDSLDNLSFISGLSMGSAGEHLDSDDEDELSQDSASGLFQPIYFGSTSTATSSDVQSNLRDVLSQVLDHLDDDFW